MSASEAASESLRKLYEHAFGQFGAYLAARDKLNDAMALLGIQTRNVDPLANFAEVIVARDLSGTIQPAANKGFDVLAADSSKVQVKSLRVSSAGLGDNCLDWYGCTRVGCEADGPLIDADWLAVVVYLDSRPHSLLYFRLSLLVRFPIVDVRNLLFSHAVRLLRDRESLVGDSVRIVDLANWSQS
jgi:hypothetical protein